MDNESEQGQDGAFSRNGVVAPMGTLISELKTKVDPDTDIAFRKLCNEAGTDVSSALRNWIYKLVHQQTYDEILFHAMKSRAAKLFPEGPNGSLSLPVKGEVQ